MYLGILCRLPRLKATRLSSLALSSIPTARLYGYRPIVLVMRVQLIPPRQPIYLKHCRALSCFPLNSCYPLAPPPRQLPFISGSVFHHLIDGSTSSCTISYYRLLSTWMTPVQYLFLVISILRNYRPRRRLYDRMKILHQVVVHLRLAPPCALLRVENEVTRIVLYNSQMRAIICPPLNKSR